MVYKKRGFISLFTVLYIIAPCISKSEAWNQGIGKTQAISQIMIENRSAYNSETGGVKDQNVQANHWILYFEHGLRERLNIGAQIYASSYYNESIKDKNFGVEYLDLFFRQTLFDYNGKFTGAFKGLIKLPGVYEARQDSGFFKKQRDYEAGIEIGYGATYNNYYLDPYDVDQTFFIASLRYRYRDEIIFNETRFELTAGHKIKDKYIIMAEFQKINYIFDSDQESSANFLSLAANRTKLFNPTAFQGMAKFQISLIRKIEEDYYLQVGYYRSIFSDKLFSNVNDYDIDGVIFGLWCTF